MLGQFLPGVDLRERLAATGAAWGGFARFPVDVAFTGPLGVNGTAKGRDDGVICNKRVTVVGVLDGASNTLSLGGRPPSKSLKWGW